jgi:sodium transport system permease protein
MKLGKAPTVFRKELLDQLRDRRTLISMIVIPILLFPVLVIGTGYLLSQWKERTEREKIPIMLLGAEHAPALAEFLRAKEKFDLRAPTPGYAALISAKELRAAVEFPAHFEAALQSADGTPPTVVIYYYAGELRSRMAVGELQDALGEYTSQRVRERLAGRGVSPHLLNLFETEEKNVASAERVSGAVLGGLIFYLIALMSLTGAMYPAIDLTAGEKERGTIEAILASPATRTELVVGKFLAVFVISIASALLSLASLAATFSFPLLSTLALREGTQSQLSLVISAKAVAAVFLMVLPLAGMFAALLLTVSVLAKSYKEAQSYVTPLLVVIVVPVVGSLLPGVDLNARLALVPVLNVGLVSKEILTGSYPWAYIGLIFASSSVYAAAALFVAVRAFQRESVLFRT